MPPLPPIELVLEISLQGLLVPFVVSVAVAYLCARWLGRPGIVCGGLLAVVLGFLAGNYFRQAVEFRLDPERPFVVTEILRAAYYTITDLKGALKNLPPARYWLPWATLLAALGGLLVRIPRLPIIASWVLRVLAAVIVGGLLVEPALRFQNPWLWPVFALVLLANCWILDVLSQRPTSRWLPAGMVWMFLSAATVLIHAHTARMTDIAAILAGCWMGLSIVGWVRPTLPVCASALPVTAIALPGLMLIAQQSTFSEIPLAAFVLIAVAPTVMGPLLLIPSCRHQTWAYVVAGWLLILIPTLFAIVLAVRAETLSFE